ncbi:hypothetical protein R1flu_029101 [Riccia fluitans]|uniref:Uncharacterized protein n=1 Tax=Riccia fluitans TaxID=41844 RepID=A0ABD1XSM9_9MARC
MHLIDPQLTDASNGFTINKTHPTIFGDIRGGVNWQFFTEVLLHVGALWLCSLQAEDRGNAFQHHSWFWYGRVGLQRPVSGNNNSAARVGGSVRNGREHQAQWVEAGTQSRYTFWATDIGSNIPDIDLCGTCPFCLAMRDGVAHGVLLWDSNGMDYRAWRYFLDVPG